MKLNAEIIQSPEAIKIVFSMSPLEFVKMLEQVKSVKKIPEKVLKAAVDLSEKKQALFNLVKAFKDKHDGLYPNGHYKEFMKYWGEASPNGKSIRYEKQKFFDMPRRLATFWKNTKPDEKNKLWEAHNIEKSKGELFDGK